MKMINLIKVNILKKLLLQVSICRFFELDYINENLN
jgi:hypothetical protein